MKCFLAVLVFAALFVATDGAFAQANVVENQSTHLYVSPDVGSDVSSGLQSAPLRTISAAISKASAYNAQGIPAKISINPGVYRETVNIAPSSGSAASMTIEAAQAGTAVIDGADVLTHWQELSSGEYVHSWDDTVAGCPTPPSWPRLQPIAMRAEMVFVNGKPLTQIITSSEHYPGTFYVNSGSRQIYIWPPVGTDMYTAQVEVSSRRTTLTVNGRHNIVLRGLVLRHAASCMDTSGANVYNSSNVLLDHVQAIWNNWGGLQIGNSSNITVQNSIGSYNGGVGFGGYKVVNAHFLSNETDYNNWRGATSAFYDFGMGGIKIFQSRGTQVIGHKAYRNLAEGVWFDTDNKDMTISNIQLSENLLANLKLEGNEGPVRVEGSSFCSGGYGILLTNTAGVTVIGNNFYDNGGSAKWQAQIFLAGNPSGGRLVKDWQTGRTYRVQTSNVTMTNDAFGSSTSDRYLFATYIGGGDWSAFTRSLHSTSNKWKNLQTPDAFVVPGGHHETLDGWKNITGQDHNSVAEFSSEVTRNCGVPAPSYPDFNVYANNRVAASVPVWAAPYRMSHGVGSIPLQVKSFSYGAVSLSTSPLPSGVTASFSASSLTNGSSILTLRASNRAAWETIPVTVFARSGSRVHTVTIPVAIAP